MLPSQWKHLQNVCLCTHFIRFVLLFITCLYNHSRVWRIFHPKTSLFLIRLTVSYSVAMDLPWMRMAAVQASCKDLSVTRSVCVLVWNQDKKCLSFPHLRPPSDEDECTQFPSVCPFDRPVCTNTYGSYKCRAKRRCNQGFEPNDDGSACVGEWS